MYKFISYKDVQRLVAIIELEKYPNYSEINNLAKSISEYLDSVILSSFIYYFPSNTNSNNDFTYVAILSTSHIVISSYQENEKVYLDIDVAWCSGKIVNIEEFTKIFYNLFKNIRIITIKVYDYLGNMMMAFSPEEMMTAEGSDSSDYIHQTF